MISVSNSFKKAIKSVNRHIFGYVDVKYEETNYNKSISEIPTKLNIYSNNGIINGSKVMKKYATLEENYTLLDNSFVLYNENNLEYYSYASNDVFENINDTTIIITNNSTSKLIKGVTIYFKDNLPFDFTITFVDNNFNEIVDMVENNTSMKYQYVFTSNISLKSIKIEISRIEFPKNRLRIAYVDFNISDLFEGEELVNFNVTEQLDLLMESLPINTCTINLNNYPNSNGESRFDIINPKGITKYLTNNTTIEPFIGVLTEDNGIEYVPMGVFYLDNWSSNPNGNVTFNGKSVLNKLQGMVIPDNGGFFALTTPDDLAYYLSNVTGYNFGFEDALYEFDNNQLIINDLIQYLQLIFSFNATDLDTYRKFYVNRKNQLLFDTLRTDIVDNISRNMLRTDVSYTDNSRINQLIIKYKSYSSFRDSTTEQVINDTHILSDNIEYVWYKIPANKMLFDYTNISINYSVISGSGVATLVDNNLYYIIVKFEGSIGSQISVTCTTSVINESKNIKESISVINEKGDNNTTIDVTSFGYFYKEYLTLIQNFYKEMNKNHKIKVQTNGDPSLEIGDSINIQTRYVDVDDGYKPIIITKQSFDFNGGLTCSLEGVGD